MPLWGIFMDIIFTLGMNNQCTEGYIVTHLTINPSSESEDPGEVYNHTWLVKYHKCSGGKFPNRQKRKIKRWTCHFQKWHQHNFSPYPFSNTVVFDKTITKSIRNCVTFGVKHEPRKWPIWHLQPPSAFHDTSRHNSYKIPIYTLLKWTINIL